MLGRKALPALERSAPDSHLLELAHAFERGDMGARLDAAADERENAGVGRASHLVTAAETAAVRISVISVPAIVASGSPVSGRMSTIVA